MCPGVCPVSGVGTACQSGLWKGSYEGPIEAASWQLQQTVQRWFCDSLSSPLAVCVEPVPSSDGENRALKASELPGPVCILQLGRRNQNSLGGIWGGAQSQPKSSACPSARPGTLSIAVNLAGPWRHNQHARGLCPGQAVKQRDGWFLKSKAEIGNCPPSHRLRHPQLGMLDWDSPV